MEVVAAYSKLLFPHMTRLAE